MYQVQGRIEAATVVGYITPHRGDQSLFWRRSNWQPLCATNVGRNRQSLVKLRQRIVSVSQEASAATGLAKRCPLAAASWTSWVGSSEERANGSPVHAGKFYGVNEKDNDNELLTQGGRTFLMSSGSGRVDLRPKGWRRLRPEHLDAGAGVPHRESDR